MVYLRLLPKIWFKPREAFEELKGNTNGEDGVITLVVYSLIALVIFAVFANMYRTDLMLVQFGFGYALSLKNIFIYFPENFLGIIIVAYIANWAAKKFSGEGNFQETLSFYCYGKSLAIVQAIASVGVIMWMNSEVNNIIAALNQGVVLDAGYIAQIVPIAAILSSILGIWLIYIQTEGISVAHNLPRLKSFGVLMFANIIAAIISFMLNSFIVIPYLI